MFHRHKNNGYPLLKQCSVLYITIKPRLVTVLSMSYVPAYYLSIKITQLWKNLSLWFEVSSFNSGWMLFIKFTLHLSFCFLYFTVVPTILWLLNFYSWLVILLPNILLHLFKAINLKFHFICCNFPTVIFFMLVFPSIFVHPFIFPFFIIISLFF